MSWLSRSTRQPITQQHHTHNACHTTQLSRCKIEHAFNYNLQKLGYPIPKFVVWWVLVRSSKYFANKSAGLSTPSTLPNLRRCSAATCWIHNNPVLICRVFPSPFLFIIPKAAFASPHTSPFNRQPCPSASTTIPASLPRPSEPHKILTPQKTARSMLGSCSILLRSVTQF